MVSKQFHATPAHVLQNYQCQVRLMVKMRFLMGGGAALVSVNVRQLFVETVLNSRRQKAV